MAEESTDKAAANDVKSSSSRGCSGTTSINRSSIGGSTDSKRSSSQDREASPTSNTHQSPTRKSRSPGCHGGEAHLCSRNCINHDDDLTFEEGKMAVEECDDDVDGTLGDLDHSADADALEVPDSSGDSQNPRSGSAGAGSSEEGPSPRDMSPSGTGRRLTVYNVDGAEPAANEAGDQPLLQADGPSEDQGRQDSGVCGPWARSLHRQPPTRARNRSRSRSRSQGLDTTLNRSRNGNCDLGCHRNRGSSRSRSPIRRRNLSPVRREPDRAAGGRVPQSRGGASGFAAGPAATGGRQKALPGPRIGQDVRRDDRPSSLPPPPQAAGKRPPDQWTYQRRREHPWDGSAGRAPGFGHAHELLEGPRPAVPCRGDGSALPYKNRRGGRALEHADGPSGQRGWGPGHAAAPREPRPRSPAPVHGMRHPDNSHPNHNRQESKHQHQHERRFAEQQPTYAPGPGGAGSGRPNGVDEFNAARVNGAPRDLPASIRGPFRGGGDLGSRLLQAPPLRRGPSPPPPPPPPPQQRQRSGPENQICEYTRGPLADPPVPPDMGTDWGREPRSPGAMSYREKGPYMEDRSWVSGPAPGAGHQRGEDRRGVALVGPSSGSGPGSDYGPRWAPPHLAARIPLGFRAPTDRSGPPSPQSDPRGGERFPEAGRYRRGPPPPPPPPPPPRRHSGGGDGAWAHNGRRSLSPPPHRRHGGSDLPGGPTYDNTGPFRRPVSPYRSGLRSPQSARWEAAPYSAYDGRTSPPHDPGFIGRHRSPPAPMYGTQGSDRFIVDDGRNRGPAYLPPSPPQMRARLPPQDSNDPRDGPAPSRHRGMRSPPRHFPDRGPTREYSPLPPGAAAAAAAAVPPPAAPRFGDLNSRNSYERRRPSAGGDEPSSFELASYGRGRPPHIRRPLSPRSFDATLPDAKRRGAVDVSGRGERGPSFEAGRGQPPRQPGSPRRTAPPNPGHHGHHGHANFRDGMGGKGRGCVSPDRHFGHGQLGGGMDPDPSWDRRIPDHGNDRRLHHARSPPLGRRSDRGDGAPPPHVGGPPTHGSQHASEVNRNSMRRSSDGGRMYGADGSNRFAAAAAGGGSGHTARSGLHASGVTAGQMGATNVGISAAATMSTLHDEAAMVWFYIDPMGQKQGPCSIQQFQSWLKYLGQNAAFQDDYEKFRTCSVWKDPQHQNQHQQEGGRDGVTRDGFSEKRTTTLSDLLQSLR